MSNGRYYPYSEYRSANDQWLSDIPAHWREIPIKYVSRVDNSGSYGSDQGTHSNDLPVATTAQIGSDGRFFVDRMPIRSFSDKDVEQYGCRIDDILVVKSSGSAENIISGKAGLVDSKTPNFAFSNFLMRLVPNRNLVDGRFLYSLIVSELTRERVKRMVSATTYPNLQVGEYVGSCIPLPPLSEQIQIAAFLEHETAKIDRLIEKQEELIRLLKEKRQAVISHAVSKGLNPHAPLKDSGIEWLGQVPAHWVVSRVKYNASLAGRIGFRGYTTDDLEEEGNGAITLSPSNFNGGNLTFEKKTYISWRKYHESPEIKLALGDIVMVKTGSTLGKIGFVDRVAEPMTINPQIVIFKDVKLQNRFLFHHLSTPLIQSNVKVSNTGGTMPTMTQECIGNYPLLFPPIKEQDEIVTFLSERCRKFDSLIEQTEKASAMLQERRTALISAAVTGKIDVRHWRSSKT